MKKALFLAILALSFLSFHKNVSALNTPVVSESPIVSIGVGNGNTPANVGPVHESIYHGDVSVFGTVTDTDIESYHFRVIKDGGSEGHTCTEELGLFSPDNQGYASTTLSKSACGFNYNKSEFITEGFANSLLAIVNTVDLGSFAGEGEYWLVLGAKDLLGNRTNADYTMDSRVKIIVDNTAPVTNGFVTVPGLEGPFTIQTTSTDDHGVAQTDIYSATSDGITCGLFTKTISLAGSNATSSSMAVQWTPEANGTYCVGVSSKDVLGNVEQVKTLSTEIHFQGVTGGNNGTTTATSTPQDNSTTTPPTTGSGSGNGASSGTPDSSSGSSSQSGGGSSGAGANGPIANLFGVQNSGGGGSAISNPVVPNQTPAQGLGPVLSGGIGGDLGVGESDTNSSSSTDANLVLEAKSTPNIKTTNSRVSGASKGAVGGVVTSVVSSTTEVASTTIATSTEQLAQVVSSGSGLGWPWWLLLVLVLVTGGYYFYFYKKD